MKIEDPIDIMNRDIKINDMINALESSEAALDGIKESIKEFKEARDSYNKSYDEYIKLSEEVFGE